MDLDTALQHDTLLPIVLGGFLYRWKFLMIGTAGQVGNWAQVR